MSASPPWRLCVLWCKGEKQLWLVDDVHGCQGFRQTPISAVSESCRAMLAFHFFAPDLRFFCKVAA